MTHGTGRFAIIGDPVAHSLSPKMQMAAFDACGIAASYEAISVGRKDLSAAFARLRAAGFAGFNVTTPLKEKIIDLLAGCTADAAEARSVNTVRREEDGSYTGHDTDGAGLARAVRELWQFDPAGKAVLVLGSGPVARSSARALKNLGAARVWCWSRNRSTAPLVGPPPEGAVELVVSTLPPDANAPNDVLARIGKASYVFDVNYGASRSPVPPELGAARSNGLPMLLHQGAMAFEWWTGKPAPIEVMRAALGLAKT